MAINQKISLLINHDVHLIIFLLGTGRQMGGVTVSAQYGRDPGVQQSSREKTSDMVIITNVSIITAVIVSLDIFDYHIF